MELQTAKGVRDLPPQEKILMNKVVAVLKETFELYGFAPLETPIIERYETLTAKFAAGESSDVLKETFRLKDQGGRDLGLRFELTTSLARYVAMNPTLKLPFKRYEMGPVFRDGPIKLGRVRQFWQCDVDTVGTKSMLADVEIIALMREVFNKLKLDVVVKVNNRKLLNGILEQAGITDKGNALISIDKMGKIGRDGVIKELDERGYKREQVKKLFDFVKKNMALGELKKKVISAEGKEGIAELEELFSYLKQMGIKSAVFDVSLARGLAYYTGTVFEVYLKKGRVTSALAGGGRWDDMIGKFMGGEREIPAVGVAFGIVPLMEALKEKEAKEKETLGKRTPAKVYVIPINTINESLKIVQQLRENEIPVDFSLGKKGVSKNLEYAGSLEIPYVVIIGEEELKKGKVLLKEMSSGAEQLLAVKDVVKKISRR
ncbi:MAG: histidine--tRNA ligase [Nanoarchaeota archaeon]